MASEPDQASVSRQSAPAVKLRLSMDTVRPKPSSPQASSEDRDDGEQHDRPSYSPITPTLSHSSLPHQQPANSETPQAQWMEEPAAQPVDLEENPDAMATRAAISILQMQRQQTLKDMKDLNKTKQAALQQPDAFMHELKAGNLTPRPRNGVDVDVDHEESDDGQANTESASPFNRMPAAQNVVRAPPIEWSKYHIVGKSLDQMHEVQRQYPGFKEEMLDAEQKPQPHRIAAPHQAFADKLDDPSTPRRNYGTDFND